MAKPCCVELQQDVPAGLTEQALSEQGIALTASGQQLLGSVEPGRPILLCSRLPDHSWLFAT